MKQRTKSIGLLIELIVSILVFSVSCAILLQIFFPLKKGSATAYESTQALSCAQSLADQFRVEGSMALALQSAPGGTVVEIEEDTYVFFFDDTFAPLRRERRASIALLFWCVDNSSAAVPCVPQKFPSIPEAKSCFAPWKRRNICPRGERMNRQTHKVGGMNVGVISLLMIFMILCLTTFAVLAISTVYAEQNLSTRNQLSIEEYYTAENRGQEFLAWLDGQLISLAEQHGDAESFFTRISLSPWPPATLRSRTIAGRIP